MINYLETKYINLLSHKLLRFKKVSESYNFRCPYCGDSKKSKSKARGWVFGAKDNSCRYHCHNCGISKKFEYFLKDQNINLYSEYIKEKMINRNNTVAQPLQQLQPEKNIQRHTLNLKKISDLKLDHPARIYVDNRKIPKSYYDKIYYTPKFKNWVNSLIKDKFKFIQNDEPRLIIPLIDENNTFFGFQGRSFKKNDNMKYITILLDKNKPKIYGLDSVDLAKTIYVFEGPIDSFFVNNSLASAGGRIDSNLSKLKIDKSKFVIVYDNEKRSKETIKKMERAIEAGYKICIWPNNIKEKDANLMHLAKKDVESVINSNIYYGLEAKLKLLEWRKT